MQFVSRSKFVRYSPYKLRPLADFVRGKNAQYALSWLRAHENKRFGPIRKLIESAVANAKHLKDESAENLVIKKITVDEGPIFRYYKPGAMGRAVILRKRFSHLVSVLESKMEGV